MVQEVNMQNTNTQNNKNYWLVSDTHFNHSKLEEWQTRSGKWQEKLWKSLEAIPENDILIHLGDVSIGNDKEINERIGNLKCTKILIRGNHDQKSLKWFTDCGWDFVCDGLDINYRGEYVYLTHRPTQRHPKAKYNIHGHTHGNDHRNHEHRHFYDNFYHIDISPELHGFKAVRLDLLLTTATANALIKQLK